MIRLSTLSLALAVMLPVAGVQAADKAGGKGAAPAIQKYSNSLSPEQRSAAIAQFVRQWGPYVQNVYRIDVGTWSQRMVSQFAHGDAINIQRALARTTYEGASAELNGAGHRLSDEQAIDLLSRSSGSVGVNLLGETTNDLVYTPITPCRIADTRSVAAGPIAAGTSRGLNAWGVANYIAYGGSSTNCGLQSERPSAVVLNVTAVTPSGPGFATVYDGGLASAPAIASINYTTGAIVNNSIIVDIRTGSGPDYKIYTLASSHYVVDIVGYFDNPHATGLDCVVVDGVTVAVPDTSSGVRATAGTCPASYTRTSVECRTSSIGSLVNQTDLSGCWFGDRIIGDADGGTGVAGAVCCRIPGR